MTIQPAQINNAQREEKERERQTERETEKGREREQLSDRIVPESIIL